MQIYPPGTRIGQYEIASRPMMGGMGVVYFALDHGNDGRPVALKTFRPELLPDRAARDRFLREGTAWIELGSHPHIVHCYKVEYIDPTAFLVLELIAKEQNMPDASLRSWLIPGRPLPLEQALLFALQIARGMQHATEKIPGFVHRDLKPENILVGADRLPGTNINRLRVTDFGLIKTIASGDMPAEGDNEEELKPNQVQHTRGVGTPLYMAPEQWNGEPAGVFTDVYAFGCILYEILSGQYAAEGKTIFELRLSHCKGRFRSKYPELAQDLSGIVMKCLALNPTDRYGSWSEVSKTLQRVYELRNGQHVLHIFYSSELSSDEERAQASWSYNAIGLAYLDLGKVRLAVNYFEKALTITRDVHEMQGEIVTLGNLSVAHRNLGNMQQAINYCEKQLKIATDIGEKHAEGAALANFGNVYFLLGDMRQAINYFEQALVIMRESRDRRGEGATLGNLGNAKFRLGEMQQAIDYFEQALFIMRESRNRRGEGKALANLGIAHKDLGHFRRAIGYFEQHQEIASAIGDRHGEGSVSGNLGNIYALLGDIPRTITYYKQALNIMREIGDRHGEGKALGSLGNAYAKLEDVQQAIDYFQQAMAIMREIGDQHGEGNALANIGNTHRDLGNIRQAIVYCKQALDISRKINNRDGEANALSGLGLAYKDLGDVQQAITCFKQAQLIQHEIGDINGVATNSFNMALLHIQRQEIAFAIPLAREAMRIWLDIGSPYAQRAQQLVDRLESS